MIKKVLVADDDLDVHQLVHDILQINFKQFTVDRALTSKSFLSKIKAAKSPYDLILCNVRMNEENGENIIDSLQEEYPEIIDRVILLADSPEESSDSLKDVPCVSKPFCLDHFGEVIKKVCS
jgi:DNA-binding NtrC family response regulator